MRGTGKKAGHQESGKSCFPKRNIGPKLNAALQIKNGSKISQTRKCKPKSKSHAKTIGAILSKRTTTGSPSKGSRSGSTTRTLIHKKTLHKAIDTESSKKESSSKLKGEKPPQISTNKNGETVDKNVKPQKLKKRGKRKRRKDNSELDEASRLQRRTRYLLIKMKLEQNLIDAYSGEGWKGHSREKIRPEKELQRATKQILKCKLGIRDAIRQLESLSSIGCIEDTAIASDGSVYHEHIICAKCKLREAFPDNDIILCDGTCNCAFHQKCLDPPLETENIPPGDQGWFCKFCECKMEILEAMNAHLGTRFSVDSTWQDIFKEEAALPDGGSALPYPEEDWPSDDSQDHDYDPERNENSCSISTAGTEGNASDDTNSSLSLSWSFEDEILSGSKRSGIISADSDETSDCEIISGRRQRRAVDYRKLYDEMFGKDAHANEQVSEDEDWGPANKRRREKESDAASTLITLYEGEKKLPNVETMEAKQKISSDPQTKRPFSRIPLDAVEKLRQAFGENELPSRDVRENLAKQLGLDYEKVNKWFKNARYIALKTRKAERAKQLQTSPRISKESRSEIVKDKTVDLVASRDNSSASLVRALKNLKKVRRRKNPKPIITSPVKKKHHRRALLESPTNDKVTLEFDDDVSLKKQLKLLKEKSKRDKQRVDFKEGTGVQDAEKEMERLCQIKDKIEKLKQVILRLQCDKTNQWQDQSVIYVPVAELREKGRFCITS